VCTCVKKKTRVYVCKKKDTCVNDRRAYVCHMHTCVRVSKTMSCVRVSHVH
jgi:hypothetical protein